MESEKPEGGRPEVAAASEMSARLGAAVTRFVHTTRLVKFDNGLFGIRRGLIWHSYLDFLDKKYWWTPASRWFMRGDCMVCEEEARAVFSRMNVKSQVVA